MISFSLINNFYYKKQIHIFLKNGKKFEITKYKIKLLLKIKNKLNVLNIIYLINNIFLFHKNVSNLHWRTNSNKKY